MDEHETHDDQPRSPDLPAEASGPPPPPPPASAPQPFTPPPQTPAPSNGFATAALVLGIIGVVLFWTIWFGVLLGILAIIFGVLGMSRAKTGAPNGGLATAGLVLGIVALVASIVFFVLVVRVATDEGLLDDLGNKIEFCIEHPDDPSC
jgi:hypothetical protein